MSLEENFTSLCLQFNKDHILIENLWLEIEKKYSEKGRHYHNLNHLENMFSELKAVEDKILNFNTISFSVFYHDVIYDATSKLNEEKSAEFARERLQQLGVNEILIAEITEQILATKSHQQSEKSDINYLLDAIYLFSEKIPNRIWPTPKKSGKNIPFILIFFINPGERKFCSIFWNWKVFLKLNILERSMKIRQERILRLK